MTVTRTLWTTRRSRREASSHPATRSSSTCTRATTSTSTTSSAKSGPAAASPKQPRQDLLGSEKRAHGLLREGRLLGKLTHPHIVRLYETLEEPHPILILETLTGETLSYIIDTSYRRLPLSSVVNLGLHLCSAMHYLHAHGILHLDLKPSNIVSERGLAKILDLSIARPPGRGKKGAGTKQYMAPEQVRGERVGPATDVWGIGAVLYEAATDVTPFNAEYETESGATRRSVPIPEIHGDGPRRLRADPAPGRTRPGLSACPGRLRQHRGRLPGTRPDPTPDAGGTHQNLEALTVEHCRPNSPNVLREIAEIRASSPASNRPPTSAVRSSRL